MSIVWFISSFFADPEMPAICLLIFLTGFSLLKPVIGLIKRITKVKHPIHNSCQTLISCLTIGFAIGLVPVFFIFIKVPQFFLLSFTLIQCLVFYFTGKVVKSNTYKVVSILLLVNVLFYTLSNSLNFQGPGYFTGLVYFILSVYYGIQPYIIKTFLIRQEPNKLPAGKQYQ